MTAFRFAGGSSLVRSSASAASRAATSRSPFFAWKNSLVMSSAARIAALCVSTMGPCDNTFFSAWSTYAATSRVYSGGRSDRTVYSSPPIITFTACFLVLMARLPLPPPPCPPRSASACCCAPPAPIARLARLLLQEREPAQEILHPDLRRFDSLAQQLVLLLHLGGAGLDLRVGPGGARAARATFLQLGFGLLRASA